MNERYGLSEAEWDEMQRSTFDQAVADLEKRLALLFGE